MPKSDASSRIYVNGADTPSIVIGGLDAEAEDNAVDNRSVTVTCSVERKEKASAVLAVQEKETFFAIAQIEAASGSDTVEHCYFNIEVQKEIISQGAVESVQTLHETANILELVIPYELAGKTEEQISLYRCHDGQTEGCSVPSPIQAVHAHPKPQCCQDYP